MPRIAHPEMNWNALSEREERANQARMIANQRRKLAAQANKGFIAKLIDALTK